MSLKSFTMFSIVLLLVLVGVAVAGPTGIDHSGSEGTTAHPTTSARNRSCREIFSYTEEEKTAMKTTMNKCVSSINGLQTLLDRLKATDFGFSPMYVLEQAGKTKEFLQLSECKAAGDGTLTTSPTGTKSFDVTNYKKKILSKAAGSTHEAAVQLGLTNCPTDFLTSFHPGMYMRCITDYCTGKLQ